MGLDLVLTKRINKLFSLCIMLTALLTINSVAASELRYAAVGKASTLDQQIDTSEIATVIAGHIYETLYSFDKESVPQRLLVVDERIFAEDRIVRLQIRDDVQFHDGQHLSAVDVIASLNRWGKYGARGPSFFKNISSLIMLNEFEIEIVFKRPYGAWKHALATTNGGAVIYPASVADKASEEAIPRESYIGTGPYKFSEWNAQQEITLIKNPDYKPVETPASGYAGKRLALVDKIKFIPVPDAGNRVSGINTGDYHYAEQIPWDYFEKLEKNNKFSTLLQRNPLFGLVFFNNSAGIFKDNYALRRALLLTLDMQDALEDGHHNEYWKASGSIYGEGNTWHSDIGTELYKRTDPAMGFNMAQQAGYTDQALRLLVSTNYPFHFQLAVKYAAQLKAAGFNVDLQVYDWQTLLKKRKQAQQWDMFITHHSYVPDPTMLSFMSEQYPGWWQSPEKLALKTKLIETVDPVARKAVWEQMQMLIYSQLPAIKTGDHYSFDTYSPNIQGLKRDFLTRPRFWNVTLEP